ncbi:Type IV secretion system protein virB10 [Candidatus Bartonella washoeensis]|uniref:Uncharacterized protein n=1 Tax=Candidatus Bartonella washoeensis Sb944nv TaxID=1094563 RepID=J1J568_9HYPH|nr:hypothetical protein MCQ_01239 [Bartonella washoeensis Sb944nv]SPU27886.1 Type IV secretion system protein virB10 [Bartonella washoeensis]
MGTSIPCIFETALNSDQPGFASCVINRDILSDNGRVVLLDKGTQVVGEYRGGIKQRQSRLFVLWTRAKTPNGVIIPLASPATDSLGRAGFDGNINTHWWERFGSSLLLTVIDGATTSLTNKNDENLFEIVINRPGEVIVGDPNGWQTHILKELTYGELEGIVKVVAAYTTQKISVENPVLSATLPNNERIQIVMPSLQPIRSV